MSKSSFPLTSRSLFRGSRRLIQTLEASLRVAERRIEPQRANVSQMLASQASERDTLAKSNKALREENEELREEMDELRAMMEVLKAKASGTTGLVSPLSSLSASA